ncbi:hypothetical protein CDD80_2056 [Ophiocordyceps camponoti-rufipedis]|uniref:Uncharacterized protein n=1 Tax=Ophiocordyceps camponoti-rufipedis TaxID=2004952 RepID=A0A2C5Z475_9HYPO|nr:hypothetical protein CDD80_2056 [Ophiocordyceps camponoti-rufipedis]
MSTTLPDFTPRDSHSLWFASSRAPLPPHDGRNASAAHGPQAMRFARGQMIERTALARLRADEKAQLWRRAHVQNFGSAWLKPPGVPKTLHQMREEKREQQEHQEAVRREQLAQELAEAEAAGLPDDGMMDDVQLDGAQDLDDQVPDADEEYAMDEDDEDDELDEGDVDDEDGHDDEDEIDDDEDDAQREEDRQNDLVAARMRMADDAFREALVRGDADADDMHGAEDQATDQQGQDYMLDEDDLIHELSPDDAQHLNMDADLDDDIPEAESGRYEHTDSDAGVSSSSDDDDQDDDQDDSLVHDHRLLSASRQGPPQSPTMPRRGTPVAPRTTDVDLLLSQDGSSFISNDGSPTLSRRP